MLKTIENHIKGKSVAILGFGREGRATLPWVIRAKCASKIAIVDKNPVTLPEDLEECDMDIQLITGDDYQKCLNDFDVIFKSPGIVLEKEKEYYTCKILSEMDIFFERFKNQIIGITGTKGKSTTTTLMYHVLKTAGKKALLAGNIGIPVFDIAKDIDEDTILVVELSCHQLEYATISPYIGVLLNIHEEHLDHYGTMEKYTAAKENIYKNMVAGDTVFCQQIIAPGNIDANVVTVAAKDLAGDKSADIFVDGATIKYGELVYEIPVDDIALMGNHNYYDIGFVYGIAKKFGLEDKVIEEGLKTYETLPHRLQKIGVVNGVTYYDDSISTIDETTIQALNTLKNAGTVIIGGMDRGISYEALEEYLSTATVENIILMEATGKRIYEEIKANYPSFNNICRIKVVEHLEDGVKLAKELTKPGKSCVMSPAAASYGIFKNFEERGEVFKRLVLESN
ncbi:MAG: UDP-N-acetylmuramoyl-L-alanine--D-glutamate ligase [Lachnospiraceae bacterium]|nr:UDP-N-acetylmuramoyl-L-alanine--D-glutamate ligase [Lachnospiraceae bacterium]